MNKYRGLLPLWRIALIAKAIHNIRINIAPLYETFWNNLIILKAADAVFSCCIHMQFLGKI